MAKSDLECSSRRHGNARLEPELSQRQHNPWDECSLREGEHCVIFLCL